ncbi:uncharacterized protein si:ch211-151h10.2 [Myxocyprinus asiaticus]|uniref:uncharacterized protein si:ch211-151h10.2 n=1 Tax=Myxocyprinus asiaticus TaxID=70543 RepID=UPI00222255FE|nr:uncharacterized protein si:ch211-151h10.2 [Myxocyprinus asiaticus]
MPQLSAGDVWNKGNTFRGGQDGRVEEEREMLVGMMSRGKGVEERAEREQRWIRLHWRNWPKWSQCLVPIAAVWLVLLEESPLHPSVSLTQAGGRLLLFGLLCAVMGLCALAFKFLHRNGQKRKQVLLQNGSVIEKVKKIAGSLQTCITAEQDAGHLTASVNVLADGLVVSLLHEPLPDPSEPHMQGLLTRLQAVSRVFHKGAIVEEKDGKEKCALQDRVNHINSYLQERMSCVRSLLQVQHECDVSVCDVQTGLQKRWSLLEELHTRVTLSPDSTQQRDDTHTALTDTENLFTELGQFKSKIQQCRMQLETSIQLLQALRSSQQSLANTVGTTIDSAWTKQLLQSNTDLFSEIQEDFSSLEQQTSNFVIHLRGLDASDKEKTSLCSDQSETSLPISPSAVPVYTAVPQPVQSHSDPETDPEPSELTQKSHSKFSPFHLLCGMKRRTSAL